MSFVGGSSLLADLVDLVLVALDFVLLAAVVVALSPMSFDLLFVLDCAFVDLAAAGDFLTVDGLADDDCDDGSCSSAAGAAVLTE